MAAGSISGRTSQRRAQDRGGRGLPEAARRRVFSAGGRDYRWSEVIAAARARGDWAALEQRVAGPAGGSVSEWRRGRGLLTADETVAWLDRWGLDMFDVRRHLGQEDSTDPPSGDRAAWAEAVCSGALDGLAWGLAAPVAVTVDPPGAGTVLDASVLARLEAEFATWKQAVESSDVVPALIEANAAAWASVEAQELSFSDLDAAREAVLCIGLDGLSLAEVAARAGIEVGELRGMLDDLPERVRRSIVSAIPGEVLGPLADAGSYRVVKLVSKASPEAADPAVLARARALAVARAIERVSTAKITWHDRL